MIFPNGQTDHRELTQQSHPRIPSPNLKPFVDGMLNIAWASTASCLSRQTILPWAGEGKSEYGNLMSRSGRRVYGFIPGLHINQGIHTFTHLINHPHIARIIGHQTRAELISAESVDVS